MRYPGNCVLTVSTRVRRARHERLLEQPHRSVWYTTTTILPSRCERILPPTNGVARVVFSVVSACWQGVGSPMQPGSMAPVKTTVCTWPGCTLHLNVCKAPTLPPGYGNNLWPYYECTTDCRRQFCLRDQRLIRQRKCYCFLVPERATRMQFSISKWHYTPRQQYLLMLKWLNRLFINVVHGNLSLEMSFQSSALRLVKNAITAIVT